MGKLILTGHPSSMAQTDVPEPVDYSATAADILDSCQEAIHSADLDGILATWNPAAAELFGYSKEEMLGRSIEHLIPDQFRANETEIRRRMSNGERIDEYDTSRIRKNGEQVEVSVTISPVLGASGVAVGSSHIERNLSRKKRRDAERLKLAAIVEYSYDAIVGKDLQGIIVSWNDAAGLLFGYTAEEIVGHSILQLIPKELHLQEDEMLAKLRQGKRIDHFRTTRIKKNGDEIDISLTVSPVKDVTGQVVGSSKIAHDISVELRREEYISYLSQHDQLTGLPNRLLLQDRLSMMVAQARRNHEEFALLMLDLNHFKFVNDIHGHSVGDALLVEVGARLKATLRAVDTVARMGGDEFVILLSGTHSREDARLVAEKLQRQFIEPIVVGGLAIEMVSASIGICMYSSQIQVPDLMLKMADIAMYKAKASGGSQIEFFSEEIALTVLRREQIEAGLREAIRLEQFRLVYQPIVSLKDGAIYALEALLRWQSPSLGNVPPSEFIPIAEEIGLIKTVGEWVFENACRDIQTLNETLGESFAASINLSPYQIADKEMLSLAKRILAKTPLGGNRVHVEITEGVLAQDSREVFHTLDGLRQLGVRIAIDDFGTGFSNMSYLLRLSVDCLKIDRSIIRNCCEESNSAAVTKAIIALAHELTLSVVAEGVETQQQYEYLTKAGCDYVQGYHISEPLPINRIEADAQKRRSQDNPHRSSVVV